MATAEATRKAVEAAAGADDGAFERLSTLLREVEGTWALAVFEDERVRRRVAEYFREAVAPVPYVELSFRDVGADILSAVSGLPAPETDQPAPVVAFTGIDSVVPELYNLLDLQRETLARLPQRLVFWLSPGQARDFQESAPNFYSRVSGVFRFPGRVSSETGALVDSARTSADQGVGALPLERHRPYVPVLNEKDRERVIARQKRRIEELRTYERPDLRALGAAWYDLAGLYENGHQPAWEDAERAYLEAAEAYGKADDPLVHAECLLRAGYCARRLYRHDEALAHLERSHAIYERVAAKRASEASERDRARRGAATSLLVRGTIQAFLEDLDGARASYEHALTIYREIGDRQGEANGFWSLGDLQMRQGDPDGARASYERALPIFRGQRDRLGEANCLQSLGDLQMSLGDLDGARATYEQALPIYREIGARLGEASGVQSLGDLQMQKENFDSARAFYTQALPIFREIGDRLGEANCDQSLGDLQRAVSDLDGARASYEQALPIFREIGDRLGEAKCLQSLALLDLAADNPRGAFKALLKVLELFRMLDHRSGEQAVLGYLASAAYDAGELDQALVLAERSLEIGREIQDRFGQTITLRLQITIWDENRLLVPSLAGTAIRATLCTEIGDEQGAREDRQILDQVLPELPDEMRQRIEENPEELRRLAVQEAANRLREAGRDPFDPPGG